MKKKALSFFVELLVVFIGAYSAFTLSNRNEAQLEKKNRINFYKNFLGEIKNLNSYSKQMKISIDKYLSSFDDSLSKGLKPRLKDHNELNFTMNLYITKAVFNTENFSNMGNRDYLLNVDMGTNSVEILREEIDRYKANCQQLLYFSKYQDQKFYNDKGVLFQEYQWYINDLKRISKYLGQLIVAIEKGAIPSTQKLILLEEK